MAGKIISRGPKSSRSPALPPDGPAVDAAVAAESAALDALALVRSGSAEAFAMKMRYLVAHSHEDEHDEERLIAIRTAVEEWLRERARV